MLVPGYWCANELEGMLLELGQVLVMVHEIVDLCRHYYSL